MTYRKSLLASCRRLCARWIATPWWNFRFWLGYRIGGFTHARRDYE